ncbi:SprB repeat-containing protein [Chitinophaga filiformis]|uniref:T9SS type A sorting domain-containing protein n=1 Tax=Chitinophaga filiformis TaxID=104663 RepID=A0ABY4HUL4_CHIFI|nr:SprB repeat-containing protein [Chitinophaga filiformis]UPK67080.1 T9SS type A sorting domain-containing protein [Chitinophaga filiformis]
MLIDRTYSGDDIGYLITKDGDPNDIFLYSLGQYGQNEVYRGNIMLWAGDMWYSYSPTTFSTMDGLWYEYAYPYWIVDEKMIYPVDNNALAVFSDPNSKLMEDVPYVMCTQTGPGPHITFRARRVFAMAVPYALDSTSFNKTICANQHFPIATIGTNATVPSDEFVTFTTEWEYQANGGAWQGFYSEVSSDYATNGAGWQVIYVNPEASIPEVKSSVQNVRFRYRHKAVYKSGTTYYSPYSPISDPIEILPSAPKVANNDIQITASCAGTQHTGSITIAGSAIQGGFSTMRWVLRNGIATAPCDPSANNCGDLNQWSNGAVPVANGISISGLAAGTYSLWLLNPGADVGSCYTPYVVTVPELSPLTVVEDISQHTNVSCYNASDGAITVTAGGADTNATYLFTLLSGGSAVRPDTAGTGKSMTWTNLPAGTYKAQVKNSTCNINLAFTNDITITQPAPVRGTLVATSPLCVSPGDGSISVAATGAVNYQFNLYNGGSLVKQSGVINSNTYTFTDLPGGTYITEVVNNDAPLCPKWDSTVTLNTLTPLAVKFVSKDSVSCFGGNDGRIEVAAEGGAGAYTFTLTGNGLNKTNSTGIFTGLPAGDYTIILKNQGTVCNDESILNVTVFQRTALNVQLQQTSAGCSGQPGAVIQAIVSGGSGSYSYNWQQLKNGVWTSGSFWFDTDTQIEDLPAGTYRVIVTDRKSPACSITSTESTVQTVSEVQITNVKVQDAVCLADGAHISITATGGDGAYVYEWSLDGATYHPFTSATALTTSGNYRLRVTDGRGCMATASGTYAVILPPAPVSFTYTLSDYNGYNVSCKGNDNGFAQITATGGNGGSYGGYTYAIDNGAYGTASLIESITAGTHQLHVKDGRGCINTQQITMTEPAGTLRLKITAQEHAGCGADPVGHITVAPVGGTSPYKYAIDNGSWQDSPEFTGLAAGDHTLKVKDAGGCTSDISTTLTAIYTPLVTTADITDIKCYGESNGALHLHVSGGDGNYSYQWSTPSLSGSAAENIPSGDYTISITDGKGCKQQVTYTIDQPKKLELTLTSTSICEGASDGSIDAVVSGGTTPYKYSLDHSSWLNAGSFKGLSEGKYNLAVQDAHGCEASGDVTITKTNAKPEVNFLVASRRNAFDTLVIKDISLPEPDNISWSYDPKAVLLGYDNGTPLIKFTDPGSYWVEMTATFGACTYTVRKDLEIAPYDPHAGPGNSVPVQVIDTVMLSPNPNNGNFNFRIKLNRKQQIVAYVYDMNGIIAGKRQYAPTLQVDDSFSVGGSVTGTFILRVITETESRDVRFIISR